MTFKQAMKKIIHLNSIINHLLLLRVFMWLLLHSKFNWLFCPALKEQINSMQYLNILKF